MADVSRLPGHATEVWDWQLHGACRGLDSELFFHPESERGSARARREEWAKTLCRRCPVMERCRSHALTVREPFGVWGGLSVSERTEIIRAVGSTDGVGAAQAVSFPALPARRPAARSERENCAD